MYVCMFVCKAYSNWSFLFDFSMCPIICVCVCMCVSKLTTHTLTHKHARNICVCVCGKFAFVFVFELLTHWIHHLMDFEPVHAHKFKSKSRNLFFSQPRYPAEIRRMEVSADYPTYLVLPLPNLDQLDHFDSVCFHTIF